MSIASYKLGYRNANLDSDPGNTSTESWSTMKCKLHHHIIAYVRLVSYANNIGLQYTKHPLLPVDILHIMI